MKKRNFRKKLCCSIAAVLSLFAVCGNNLHAADITYNGGLLPATGFPQTQTVADGATVTFTTMGAKASNYVLIGWSTMKVPLVSNSAMENMVTKIGEFYAIGSSCTITGDKDFHAVWAKDMNNDGYPDHGSQIKKLTLSKEQYERIMADLKAEMEAEDNGISLRSLPAWDIRYDLPAFNDSVLYVGCTYEPEYENLIYFNPLYCFDGQIAYINTEMDFIIEYGGVLEEKSMIGGRSHRALDTIKITSAMLGMDVNDLFANYPFTFNAIKEDGEGILNMYFLKPDGTHPTVGNLPGSDIQMVGGLWGKPFYNTSDTLTIKFNIYNKPEFESSIIRQRVDTAGRIDLKHVSGTPLKYMMRCINEFRWRPADAPLTKAEREEIWDGSNICLREMDRSIGYQQMYIQFLQSDDFNDPSKNPSHHVYSNAVYDSRMEHNLDSIWRNYFVTDPLYLMAGAFVGIKDTYDWFMAMIPGTTHSLAVQSCIGMFEMSLMTIANQDFHSGNAAAEALAMIPALMPAYGQYLASQVIAPAPCRGAFCFEFESRGEPTIQRKVFIPQVAGVTTDPAYGEWYVNSQEDFNFTAKYTTVNPLKVTTNRIVDGVVEELVGTPNAAGGYDYIINRVAQNIVLTFGPESVDNASIDGRAVWSHNNTIYIRVAKEDVASIYSIAGQLVKRIELSEGDNPVPMERGVYIVTLKDGSVHKVTVK